MAGLDPAIHVFATPEDGVDARDEPGHDDALSYRKWRTLTAGSVRRLLGRFGLFGDQNSVRMAGTFAAVSVSCAT